MSIEKLKYPIGPYVKPSGLPSAEEREEYIRVIENFPGQMRKEVQHLNDEQLDTPYRPDGWTIRQVVNHCADSHMNSLIRFKWALTEEKPTIKAYYEERWAELADSRKIPVEPALQLLEGLHQRWAVLLRSMSEVDYKKSFIHPEQGREVKLYENLALYAWHSSHHLAHVSELKKRMGWG